MTDLPWPEAKRVVPIRLDVETAGDMTGFFADTVSATRSRPAEPDAGAVRPAMESRHG